MESLSRLEFQRYSRHLLLPEIGSHGQLRLKAARVLVIGAGGLGSPVILYLAAAGVGCIGILDFDSVDLSNLQRQIIYDDSDRGRAKVERAAARAKALNPEIMIVQHNLRLTAENTLAIFGGYDLIVDGSDNFQTRYLVNDACVILNKPEIYASIYRFEGQASVFSYNQGPCYRCLFPEPPEPSAVPNCAEAGVLGVMAGVIGSIQASEALKVILDLGEILSGKLLLYDALLMRFDKLKIPRDPNCIVCGSDPKIKTLADTVFSCAPEDDVVNAKSIGAKELHAELNSGRKLKLLDVRTYEEVALCRIPESVHIPLQELSSRYSELDKEEDMVLYCKSGVRSLKAMELLSGHGFNKMRNLTGGILAWARDVDPAVLPY